MNFNNIGDFNIIYKNYTYAIDIKLLIKYVIFYFIKSSKLCAYFTTMAYLNLDQQVSLFFGKMIKVYRPIFKDISK